MSKRPRRPESPPRAQADRPAANTGVRRAASWIGRPCSPAAFATLAAALSAQTAHRTAHSSAHAATPKVEVAPGTLVRWAAAGHEALRDGGPLLEGDGRRVLLPDRRAPQAGHGRGHAVERQEAGERADRRRRSPYGTEDVTLPDIPQAHPTPEDEARNAREQERVAAVWKRKPGPARFSLPLGNPAKELPEARRSAGIASSTASPPTSPTWARTTRWRRARRFSRRPTEKSCSRRRCSIRATA